MSFSYDGGQRSHHVGGGGGRRDAEPQEWTPQELAEQAKNVAGNLTRTAAQVTAACASVTKATTPKAQAAAKDEAGRALEALRHAATAAAPRVGQASDPEAAAVLAAAPAMVRAAAAEVDALVTPAPDTDAAASLESPGIRAFATALAPDGQSGPQARQARFNRLTGIINHELRHGDLDPLAASLRPGGALAPLFSRLPEEVRSELQRQLVDVRPRLLGKLREATPQAFDHDARGALPAHSGAPAQVDVGVPVVVGAEAAPASAAAAAAPESQDPLHALARSAAAKLGVAPRLIGGEAGRAMTEAHGARGVAHNDTVAIHPDVDPETPEGRETVAHELVHQAQAILPSAQDAGRAAAEEEAATLARDARDGGPIGAPQFAIALTTPAADKDAPAPGPKPSDALPDGVKYQHVPRTLNFRVRTSWLEGGPQRYRIQELLEVLRDNGMLAWATDAQLAAVAEATQLDVRGGAVATTFVRFGPNIFTHVGLPAGTRAMVGPDRDGLTATVQAPGVDLPAQTRMPVDAAQFQRIIDAFEAYCQLVPIGGAADAIGADARVGRAGPGVITFHLSRAQLDAVFGAPAMATWWEQHQGGKDSSGAHALNAASSAIGDLTDLEAKYIKDWVAKHLPARAGVGGRLDRRVRELIVQIENSPHKAQILAALRRGDGADGINAISLEHTINEAVFEAEAAMHGIAPPTERSDLRPVWNVPVPFKIEQRAGLVLEGETVPFVVDIEQPASFMDQAKLNELRFRPFVASIDWVFEKVGGKDAKAAAAPQATGAAVLATTVGAVPVRTHQQITGTAPKAWPIAFDLAAGEHAGIWKVTAFVRHSHYEPGVQSTLVEVKSQDLRMQEMRSEVAEGMGVEDAVEADFDFDSGPINNHWAKDGTDMGRAFYGQVPDGWQPRSNKERNAARDAERDRMSGLISYLRASNHAGGHDDAIDAATRQLSKLKRADRAIEQDIADQWIPFELRGTFLSRQAGLADGPLDLYGMVKSNTATVQERDTEGNRKQARFFTVRLRDLSRRFDSDDRLLTGTATTFDDALAQAFVKLTQAYPAGRVFAMAQRPGPDGVPTKETIGFELNTGSKGRDIKDTVFDPVANTVVNLAAVAAMIFVPEATPIILPALTAYNVSQTVDDMYTQWTEGTLTSKEKAIGFASIGLDLLPFLGRAKAIAGSRKALLVLEGIDIAGDLVYMTAAGLAQAKAMQEQHVASMANVYEQMLLLEKSTHPSDPRLVAMRAEIENGAAAARLAIRDGFIEMIKQRAVFVAAKHYGGIVNLGLAAGRLRAHGGFEEHPGTDPHYDRERGIIVGDPSRLDEVTFARLMDEQAAHMRELAVDAAGDLGVDPAKVEIVLDVDVSASIEPGRVRLGYSPKVTPAKARAMWKAQAKGGKGADGGGRQPPHGGDGAAGAAGGGGDRRPALAAKVDEVGRAATVLAAGTHHHGGGDFAVEVPGGSKTPVRVTVGDDAAKTASVRFDSDHYILELPPHLSDAEVEVVLAGKLAEVAHTETRRANGQVEATTDALGAGGKGTAFSPKDFGMLAELRALRRQRLEAQVQQGPDAAKQIADIDQRIRAHEKVMGFDDTDRGPALRQMAEVQVELEDDHLRRESERKRLDGVRGHSGFEFHTHWMGIVDAEVFRAKAAIAARGQDDGSWIPLIEAIGGMEHLKHGRASGEKTPDGPTPDGPAEPKSTEKGPIIKRKPAGDAYDIAEQAKRQVAELLEDADNKSPAVSAELHRKAESLAREAARKALAASPETDFNSAYEVRDELIKDTWAGKKPHVGKPDNLSADQKAANDAHANRGYDDYTKEALLALARDGVQYTEPSNSHGKMAKRFPPDRVAKAMDELIAAGQLEPGQIDLRFLTMTTTNHFGERRPGMPSLAVGESSEESWAYDRSQIQKQIMLRYVGGIDIAGQEFFWFDPDIGGARLRQLYTDLVGAATQRGERLVLRPHVGEGAVDTVNEKPYKRDDNRHRDQEGKLPLYERAKHNIDAVLTALEALKSRGLLDPTKVDVRFGHATHATPEQAIRMKALGITAEVNLHSNVVTGVVDQTKGVDGQPRATEQYDDHALPTLLYYDTGVVLSTDAHAVMSTTMREEYTRARRLIDEILAGERRVKIRAADAGDRGTVRPDEPDSRWLAIHEMTADERQRFTHAYEKLYADATRQFEGRPGAGNAVVGAADTANTPRGAHATDLALEHGLVSRHGDRVFEGSREQVDAAAKAYRNARYVVLEQHDPDGRLTARVRSDRGDVEIELRHVPDSQPYRDMPEPGRQERSLDRDETRDAYNGKVVRILELDAQLEAEGVPLEERARRAYDYRHRAREWARQQQEHAGQGASLEVRDVTTHGNPDGPSFDDLLAKNLAKGMSRDEAYREIIKSAARTNGTYNDKYGKKRGQP